MAKKHRSRYRIGLLKMVGELSEDADRTIRQIFGNSDVESDLDIGLDEKDFEDNLQLAVLRRSDDSEHEMEFDLSSDEEDGELEETEKWSSDILTRKDFNFDCEFVGPTMRTLPSKSALDFFHIIFTEDLYELIVTQTNLYAAQKRNQKALFELSTGDVLLVRHQKDPRVSNTSEFW